jgi:hypothetical protein
VRGKCGSTNMTGKLQTSVVCMIEVLWLLVYLV